MNKSFLLILSILLIAACTGAADIGKISDKAFEIASAQCRKPYWWSQQGHYGGGCSAQLCGLLLP